MEFTKKRKMITAILAIAFIAYQATLFSLCGFGGHTAVFWMSWVFMMAAFGAMTVSVTILGQRGMFLRDWLFGFPLVKHSTVFLTAELIASVVFILFEESVPAGWAFALQFLLLSVYGICAISCLLSKVIIGEVNGRAAGKTGFMKLLRADAEMLAERCTDPDTREECRRLAEAIRCSDPMGAEELRDLEQELASKVSACGKAVAAGDSTAARELCGEAALLLAERNRKCRAMK